MWKCDKNLYQSLFCVFDKKHWKLNIVGFTAVPFHCTISFPLRKKYPYLELFWSAFSRIRTEYGEILECGKMRTRITPNTDTFHAVFGILSKHFCEVCDYPANVYLFKVSKRNTRKMCEIYSKLTTITPETSFRYLFLVSLLLNLNLVIVFFYSLTLSRPMFPSYRNQLVDLLWKSSDWFLYDGNIGR